MEIATWNPVENHTRPPDPVVHTYTVRLLRRDRAEDWHWHPHAVGRIIQFAAEHEPQANQTELALSVQQSFVLDDPAMAVIAFFMDDALIGHMLIDRGTLYYRPIVRVHQYQLDHGVPPETRHEELRLLREWAKYPGPNGQREPAEFIEFLVRDKRLVPLYKRVFDAWAEMLVMRLRVED